MRLPLRHVVGLGVFVYFVLWGGTPAGDIDPALRVVNAVIGAAAIAIYIARAPRFADRIDRAFLLGLLFFLAACTLSIFPRQSFDAALAAFAYVGAFFIMREALADHRMRGLFIATLTVLSLALIFLFASLWLTEAAAWLSLAGEVPPLSLRYPGLWWGHRYDVVFLLVLLYPAWWIGRPRPLRTSLAIVVGVLTLLLAILSGSRTLWLAGAVASVVVIAGSARRIVPTRPAVRVGVAAFGIVVIFGLVATGLGAVIVQRGLESDTVTARGDMWATLTEAWLKHPVAGLGPGSFAWVLQTTDYFDTNTWAPRHPDSSVFQLLAEGGVLGVAAGITWVLAIGAGVLRSRFIPAKWAIAFFGVAALSTSATDFGFLIIVVLAWVAYVLPRRESEAAIADHRTSAGFARPVRIGQMLALGVIGMALVSMTGALFAHGEGRQSVARGALDDAEAALSRAIALDPGMALYWRQRGSLRLVRGDAAGAVMDLERSLRLNPYDDLPWRVLAVAELRRGEIEKAVDAINHAVDLQRSDPTNLLIKSKVAEAAGNRQMAREALAEVVQAWPTVTGTTVWRDMLPEGISTELVVEDAAARWRDGRPSPEALFDQALWLAVMEGVPMDHYADIPSALTEEMTGAMFAVLTCSPQAADRLAAIPAGDRHTKAYWGLLVAHESRTGSPTSSLQILNAIVSESVDPIPRVAVLNPLNENGIRGFSVDKWGYRRRAIEWPPIEPLLASPEWGYLNWLLDPTVAIDASGLEHRFEDCR